MIDVAKEIFTGYENRMVVMSSALHPHSPTLSTFSSMWLLITPSFSATFNHTSSPFFNSGIVIDPLRFSRRQQFFTNLRTNAVIRNIHKHLYLLRSDPVHPFFSLSWSCSKLNFSSFRRNVSSDASFVSVISGYFGQANSSPSHLGPVNQKSPNLLCGTPLIFKSLWFW